MPRWFDGESLTVWFTEEAVAAWHAPASRDRGGQPIHSAIATETGLALRPVFHQPLRQTEGLLRSIADVLGVDIAIPDHTPLSRRGDGLTILVMRLDRAEPLHLLVDSTGLKIYGEGKWLDHKHGIRSRRRWRKLHLGIGAVTHEIVASELMPDEVGDVSEMPGLLDQIDAEVASMTADGA
jgi:DDE family transposase